MANNKKCTESKKYNKALTQMDRVNLNKIIETNRSPQGAMKITLNKIGEMLEKDPTTLSKEVKKHRTRLDMSSPDFIRPSSYCKVCEKKGRCALQANMKGSDLRCEEFKLYICPHLKTFPWVCNGCPKRGACNNRKTYYNPITSQQEYQDTLSDSRKGPFMTYEEFHSYDTVISGGLDKGQSIEHILHSNDIPLSTKTVYNYYHCGYFSTTALSFHRMPSLRGHIKGKAYNSKVLREAKVGRNYEDFKNYISEHPGIGYCQMDTVEGKKGGKVCLSLKLVNIQFQFYFLLENKTARCVVDKLNEIQKIIGVENYKKLFGLCLTDNGSEFTDIDGIMKDPDTGDIRSQLFFCHPMFSGEKGSCERNHELFRYVIPKGVSFDNRDQEDFNLITSHVNSYKRKSTDYSTPLDLFCAHFGKDILDKLSIHKIDANSVVLNPDLLK